jgi:hypothetical protein
MDYMARSNPFTEGDTECDCASPTTWNPDPRLVATFEGSSILGRFFQKSYSLRKVNLVTECVIGGCRTAFPLSGTCTRQLP